MQTTPAPTTSELIDLAVTALSRCGDLHDMQAVAACLHEARLSVAELGWTALGYAIESARVERERSRQKIEIEEGV